MIEKAAWRFEHVDLILQGMAASAELVGEEYPGLRRWMDEICLTISNARQELHQGEEEQRS